MKSKYSNPSKYKTTASKAVSNEEIVSKIEEEFAVNLPIIKPILENNLFKFNKDVLNVEKGKGNLPLDTVHRELCDFIDKNKRKKKLLLIPRGHLKSTLATVGYITQQIVKNPSIRVLIANATYSLSCSFLTEIKRNLKFNENIHMIWGDLTKDAPNWSQNQITLTHSKKKEPTVTAMGVESNLTSQHFDLVVFDDVVNKDYVNTREQIEKTVSFYKECLNLLEPNGETIIIGTRWHDSDLYGWILDKDNRILTDFEVFIRRAYEGTLEKGGEFKALWEAKFTQTHLRKLYNQQGPYFFATQYLNDPIPQEDATFKKRWFQDYDPTDLKGRLLNKFIMIDPAISTEREADYTAMVVVGVDEFGMVYVLDIVRDRLTPNDINNEVFRLASIYSPIKIGIEDVAFQKSLQYSLTEEMHKRNKYLPMQPLRPAGRNKDQRIRGLQPLYANGRILHSRHVEKIQFLEDELLRFPRGKHDDTIDALSYMLDIPVYKPKRRNKENRTNKRYLY